MHKNSIETYHSIKPFLTKRQLVIYNWLEANGEASDRQIKVGLGFDDLNAVRPRITEMVQRKQLREVKTVRCSVTKKPVRIVEVVK